MFWKLRPCVLSGLQTRVGVFEADCVDVCECVGAGCKSDSVDTEPREAVGQQVGEGAGHREN